MINLQTNLGFNSQRKIKIEQILVKIPKEGGYENTNKIGVSMPGTPILFWLNYSSKSPFNGM